MKSKFKFYATAAIMGVSIFGITLAARGVFPSIFATRTVADTAYSITLNNSNKYTSGSTKQITTDSKNYEVKFSYDNCSAGGVDSHVVINNNGTVKNADHILSISSILPTFTAENDVELQFRASYDKVKWGDYATLTSAKTFDLSESKPYYIELKAVGGPVTLNSLTITYLCTENPEASSLSGVNWKLVLKNDEIEYDKEYVLASLNDDYALSTSRNESRAVTSINGTNITKNSNGTLNINDNCEILTLKHGITDYSQGISNSYAFETHDGMFLNAEANQKLSLKPSINQYTSFDLSMCTSNDFNPSSDYIVGSIDAQCVSSGNHNRLSFNGLSSIFGCRTIGDGNFTKDCAIGLYKKVVGGSGYPLYPTKITATDSLANSFYTGDIFANTVGTSSGLNVTLHFSDFSSEVLTKDHFDYVVKNSSGTQIDPTEGFTAEGTYTVTVTDKTYGLSYSYDIVVTEKPIITIVDVESVSISSSASSVRVGETISFTADVQPSYATNKKVAWESSDSATALVDPNGVVTGVKAGDVTITARTLDGGFTDSETITVVNKPVTSITLNENSLSMNLGGSDAQLTATINQDATIQTISWSSSNQSVATVSADGKVHAVSEGTATITAKADGNLTATCAVTVLPRADGALTATFTFTNKDGNFAETESAKYGEWKTNNAYGFEENRGIQWSSPDPEYRELNFKPTDFDYTITSVTVVASNNKDNTKEFSVRTNGTTFASFTVGKCTNSSFVYDDAPFQLNNNEFFLQIDDFPTGSGKGSLYIKSITLILSTSGGGGTTVTKTLESISVSGQKTSFNKGDSFSFGGAVTAHYNDGSQKNVTSSATFTGYNMNNAESQTVTVSYSEGGVTQTTTYSINVLEIVAQLIGISISGERTEFTVGDTFSFGGVVYADYDDGSYENVTDSATFTGYNLSSTGTQTVTVHYSGFTTTYSINVKSSGGGGGDIPVGDDYQITFAANGSDSTANLTTSTIRSEIETGSSCISSFSEIDKVYSGSKGLKFGSSKGGGYMSLSMSSTISSLETTGIEISVAQYSSEAGVISVYVNDDSQSILEIDASEATTKSVSLTTNIQISSLKISSVKRVYLKGITIFTQPLEPVDPTSIAINPSSLTMTRGEKANLSVTYEPTNANQNKGITWSTRDISGTNVVSVNSSGVVTANNNGTAEIKATSTLGLTSTINVVVKDIAVQSITVSPGEAEISIGSTKQLSATVSPYNATNQNVTWSSTNSAVASVDNAGLVTARAAGTATIKATSATSSSIYGFAQITVTEKAIDKWTIMMYVCGADLESESGLASGDFEEILKVSGQPNDVNIIIQTGGASSWSSTYGITANANQRYHVENRRLVCDNSKVYSSYKSMGQSSTFADFVTWGLSEYPAEKTGVVLWNHGGGMRGVCYDERSNDDSLLNAEVKSGMATAFANVGRSTSDKLEFIGYDACLMQAQDIAEFNSQYFNYMVASQESEAGYGWDYDNWVDELYRKESTETILKSICDTFIADNGGVNSRNGDQTLSYLNLAYMSTYKTAFESFASQLKSTFGSGVSKNDFYTWMHNNVKYFGGESDDDEYFGMFDVKDFLNKIANHSKYSSSLDSYRTAALNALNNLVVYSTVQKGAGNAYGLCCIYSKTSGNWLLGSNYGTSQTNFSNWRSFVSTYGAI